MSQNVSYHVRAPAKINLTLHVTGQRPDGYHILDSLVVFADVCDTLTIKRSHNFSFTVKGTEAAGTPANDENLVLKVARLFLEAQNLSLVLKKSLPVSSGIGGGSADAAAAFRGLLCHSHGLLPGESIPTDFFNLDQTPIGRRLFQLGADIPVCVMSQTMRMRGIGENLKSVQGLPEMWAILVNPRVAISTPTVFKKLTEKSNLPMPDNIPKFKTIECFVSWLAAQRNDLEQPAMSLVPEIKQVIDRFNASSDCMFARMSGSGATCFGLYANKARAMADLQKVQREFPNWWVRNTFLGSSASLAMPRAT